MPAAESKTFAGKFLEKIGKISPQEIENFLSRVQSEKTFFESVLNNLLEGVVVTDHEGRILFANRAVRAMLGWGRRRIIGESFLEQISDRRLHDRLQQYNTAGSQIENLEITLFGAAEKSYQITLIPVRDETLRTVSIVTLFRDITERQRAEDRRIQAERLASLATLTAGVAHEIKNPLNNLNIHAHLLRRTLSRPAEELRDEVLGRAVQSAEILTEEVERLSRIVDEFLQAARPTQPQFKLCNVNDVLRKLAFLMESEVAERGTQVEMNLDTNIPPSRIDEIQLSLAFRNLVKNSLEAMEPQKGRIWIRSSLTNENIRIDFSDNGPGIPEEQLSRIFEPYVTTKFHGTGLGLMVVYRIVHEHKGEIQVQSELGKGTRIIIELPLPLQPRNLLPGKA